MLRWSKHSLKRKLWVFLQYGGREIYYSHSFLTFGCRHFQFQFSFGTRIAHQEKVKLINEYMCTPNLSDWMYVRTDHKILSCVLLCCNFEDSLHAFTCTMTQNIKSINEYMRTPNLSDWMYVHTDHKILSCVLLCCNFEGSLHAFTCTMTQNIRQLYVVELVVGSEQKLYFYEDNCHRTSLTCMTTTKHPFRKV